MIRDGSSARWALACKHILAGSTVHKAAIGHYAGVRITSKTSSGSANPLNAIFPTD